MSTCSCTCMLTTPLPRSALPDPGRRLSPEPRRVVDRPEVGVARAAAEVALRVRPEDDGVPAHQGADFEAGPRADGQGGLAHEVSHDAAWRPLDGAEAASKQLNSEKLIS